MENKKIKSGYKMWHLIIALLLGGVIGFGISFVPAFGTKGFIGSVKPIEFSVQPEEENKEASIIEPIEHEIYPQVDEDFMILLNDCKEKTVEQSNELEICKKNIADLKNRLNVCEQVELEGGATLEAIQHEVPIEEEPEITSAPYTLEAPGDYIEIPGTTPETLLNVPGEQKEATKSLDTLILNEINETVESAEITNCDDKLRSIRESLIKIGF